MAYSFLAEAAQLQARKDTIDSIFKVVFPAIRCCNNCAHCVERAATPGTPFESIGQMYCDQSKVTIRGKTPLFYDESYRENDCISFEQVEQDDYLQEQWKELEDAPVFEDANGASRLDCDWWLFKKGTTVDDVWHYFDHLYTGGVVRLMGED